MNLEYNKNFHIHRKNKVAIIWTPKAACTTVNHMIFEHEGLLENALLYNKWIHKYRQDYMSNYNIKNKRFLSTIPDKNYIQFCVNPYRRAVSSYIHAMTSRKNYIGQKNKNISFLMFLKRLLNGEIKPNTHHNKQTFFINNYNNIYIVKMEHIKKEIKIINQKFNLNYKYKKNQNVKKKINIVHFVGNTKWDYLSNTIPDDYTLFYNNHIKNLVEKIYHEDIKNLNYTWQMFVDYERKKYI